MSPEGNDLDRIFEEICNEAIDPAAVEAAAARVRAGLPRAALRTCADFQALMPDYRAGKLPAARALLVEDHTRECAACRKALAGEGKVTAFIPRRTASAPAFRWAMAAGFAALAAFAGYILWTGIRTTDSPVFVQAAAGALYRITPQGSETLQPGVEVAGPGEIRTAGNSTALLRLRDGSLVEMRERSSLSVAETGRDLTIHLAGGNVIVEAAKRRSGRLYVAARDCRVAVTGTVFTVNSGIKGSRVSVLEGQVRVAQAGREQVLQAGDQYSSSPAVGPVPVAEEIAWSTRFEQHMALIKEFAALDQQLRQVRMPDLRYSSRLIHLLPPETVIYAAVPNLGKALGETYQILQQRAAESAALRQWWEQGLGRAGMSRVFEELEAVSEFLGDEIVIAATLRPDGKAGNPVLLAEVKRTGLRDFLLDRFQKAGVTDLRISESLEALEPAGRGKAIIYTGNDLAAVAGDAADLLRALSGGGFAATGFGARAAEAYRDGAGIIFAADLERLAPQREGAHANFKYAVVEQKETGGRTDTQAVLAFLGSRKGPFGWLGQPAPLAALDYISPQAGFAAAAIFKDPAAIFDELAAAGEMKDLAEGESKLGIQIRNDLLASLGGEIAVAFDGPAVPVPSWKLIAEVRDANRLQWTIRALAEAVNRHAAGQNRPGIQITEETVASRTWYRLLKPGAQRFAEAHYTFDNGYLVAGPSRALVEQAIGFRASGHTLARSAAFTSLLPRNRYADFSAMTYQNMGSSLAPLMEALRPGGLTAEQKQAIEGAAAGAGNPMLVTCYGEPDRITVATGGNLLGLNPANLVRLTGPLASLSTLMSGGKPSQRPARAPDGHWAPYRGGN